MDKILILRRHFDCGSVSLRLRNAEALISTSNSHQADMSSRVDFKIWHRSQSKKKGKKRNLVASATHSLGELLKKQAAEPREWYFQRLTQTPLTYVGLEIRLHCQSATNRAIASRGKPQNGALMHLRVKPPIAPSTSPPLLCPSDTGYSSDASSCKSLTYATSPSYWTLYSQLPEPPAP